MIHENEKVYPIQTIIRFIGSFAYLDKKSNAFLAEIYLARFID